MLISGKNVAFLKGHSYRKLAAKAEALNGTSQGFLGHFCEGAIIFKEKAGQGAAIVSLLRSINLGRSFFYLWAHPHLYGIFRELFRAGIFLVGESLAAAGLYRKGLALPQYFARIRLAVRNL
jgi:hypothetical protein